MRKYLFFIMWLSFSVSAQPDWYGQPLDGSNFYYGYGVGETLAEAKLSARSEIVSSIRSKLSYTINQFVETAGQVGSRHTSSTMTSSTEEVMLPEVIWLRTNSESGIYYVLAQPNKAEFVELYELKLSVVFSQFYVPLDNEEINFSTYLRLLSYKPQFLQAAEQASIISSSSEQGKYYFDQAIHLMNIISKEAKNFCVDVEYKGTSSFNQRTFKPMIENVLTDSGFILKSNMNCEPVTIRTNTKTNRDKDERVDKITLFIDMGSPVNLSKRITFFGRSSGSKKSSYSNSVDNFETYFALENDFASFLFDKSRSKLVIQ